MTRVLSAAVQCRSDDDGARFIAGLIVPWDVEIVHGGAAESFAPGSLRVPGPVPLRYGHVGQPGSAPVPIGRLVDHVDTDAGMWAEFRLLATATAQEAWAVADDGLVTGFSIEFRPEQRSGRQRGQGRVTRSDLVGTALVERPAYRAAHVAEVRALTPRLDDLAAWRQQRRGG